MMERSMTQLENMSTPSAALDQNSTLICVVEMSLKSWLVAGMVPGIKRQPLKKLETTKWRYIALCFVGRPRRRGLADGSHGSPSPSRPVETVSGSLAGCGLATSKLG
jgi:hypothetical protein